MTAPMTEEAIARVEDGMSRADPEALFVVVGANDLTALLSLARQGLEMRELLLTVRDYVSDMVEGHIEQSPALNAMARDDLFRIDAALQSRSR